jgi:ElaB/YqjD/DUF883 family membrane-anchored ribosome-binding protein
MQTQHDTQAGGRHLVKDTLAELETLRDEIRVRIHLAGMDAKTTWNELEPKIEHLEEQAKEATDHAAHALRDRANELVSALRGLRSKV